MIDVRLAVVVLVVSAVVEAAIGFWGGWTLRGLRDAMRRLEALMERWP